MALTQGAWTQVHQDQLNASKFSVWQCTVVSTTAENDAYTLKTPSLLDTSRKWTLYYKASATPDGQALPLDLWVGYSDNFAISGDSTTVTATDGANFKNIMDDVVLAVSPLNYAFDMDPNLAVADVVTVSAIASGLKVKVPVAPYYAFNLDGGSTLAAVTHTFTIVQAVK